MLEQEGESKEEISNLINNYVKKIDLQALAGISINSPIFNSFSQISQIDKIDQMSSKTAGDNLILSEALISSTASSNSSTLLPVGKDTTTPILSPSPAPILSPSPSPSPSLSHSHTHSSTLSPSHSPIQSSSHSHSRMPSHLPSKTNPIRTSKSLLPKSLFSATESEHPTDQSQLQLQNEVGIEVGPSGDGKNDVQSSEPVRSTSSRDVDLLKVIEMRASQIEQEVSYYYLIDTCHFLHFYDVLCLSDEEFRHHFIISYHI